MALFKQSPLPFTGQKRQFLTHFKRVLEENIPEQGEGWTIVDVFGGSDLLSHTAKQLKPKARVIYNDFDGYTERLKHIPDTNRLRGIIASLVEGIPKHQRLDEAKKAQIIAAIEAFEGYIDLYVLSSWLLFSSKQVGTKEELYKENFWQCLRKSDYPEAEGYFADVEVVSEPFHRLLPQFQTQANTLLVLDPPYLCTHQESYKQEKYFDLVDFMQLIQLTRPPYIFFSSTKSEFIRFIEAMIEGKWKNWETFEGYQRIARQAVLNYQGKYEDNLVYKF